MTGRGIPSPNRTREAVRRHRWPSCSYGCVDTVGCVAGAEESDCACSAELTAANPVPTVPPKTPPTSPTAPPVSQGGAAIRLHSGPGGVISDVQFIGGGAQSADGRPVVDIGGEGKVSGVKFEGFQMRQGGDPKWAKRQWARSIVLQYARSQQVQTQNPLDRARLDVMITQLTALDPGTSDFAHHLKRLRDVLPQWTDNTGWPTLPEAFNTLME